MVLTRALLLVLACSVLAGCASGPIGAHQPSLENVQVLRANPGRSLAVGDFKPAAGTAPAMDRSVSVRGSSLTSPVEGSFAAYLRSALIEELRTAGRYDPGSSAIVSGELAENALDAAGMSQGHSTLAARIRVTDAGNVRYDKLLREARSWQSSFIGAVAIPEAINQYTEMYTKFLAKLFADEEFKAATRGQ